MYELLDLFYERKGILIIIFSFIFFLLNKAESIFQNLEKL